MKTSFWTELFDLISPRPCIICGRRLSVNESVLCVRCHLRLPFTKLEDSPLDNPMARLFWGILPVERAAAWIYYHPKSNISNMVFAMKYHYQPELCRQVGTIIAQYFASRGFFEGIDAIVPIPITRRRQRQRGYNQSMEIARGISMKTGLPIYNKVVERTKFHDSQTKKKSWERRENVKDAFQLCDGPKIEGLHLLIVDDIVTTGATVIACGQELAKSCSKLSILSLGLTR